MGQIHLIRHGQASFGERNYDRLSPVGMQQSRELGRWLRDQGVDFDAVYCGERERQQHTARLALGDDAETAPALHIDPSFNELDADRLLHHALPRVILRDPEVGRLLQDLPANRDAFRRVFERIVDEWVAGDWQEAGIGDWSTLAGRVRNALSDIARRHGPGQRIAVFTSGGPITAMLQQLGVAADGRLDWNIANTSVTRIDYDADGNFRLQTVCELPHLAASRELVTHL